MPYVITTSSKSPTDDFSCTAQVSITGDGHVEVTGPASAQAIHYSVDNGDTWVTINPTTELPHSTGAASALIKVEGAVREYTAASAVSLSLTLGGPLTPGSTVTLTATIAGSTVTELTSVILAVGDAPVVLSGTGMTRTGVIPADAVVGAVIAAVASASAAGQTISGSTTGEVAANEVDFIITSIAQWTSEIVDADASTTDGKTVLLDGKFDILTLPGKNWTRGITFRGAPENSVSRLAISGGSNGVVWESVNFQMGAWPKSHSSLIWWSAGVSRNWKFKECKFRHGYGSDLVDLEPTFQYPEYERVDNNLIADVSGVAHPLTWLDTSITGGWIEFFNNGSENVSVRVGGSDVTTAYNDSVTAFNFGTASKPQYYLQPGGYGRIATGLNPQIDTHIALASESGTVEVNARTEVGMAEYLTNALGASSSASVENLTLERCIFSDLANAAKLNMAAGDYVAIVDCEFWRIYMDIISMPQRDGMSIFALRNIGHMPFARSGVRQNLNGDAGDPHGDWVQTLKSELNDSDGEIIVAGNRSVSMETRSGVLSNGIFIDDGGSGYGEVFAINNLMVGGSGNGCIIYPAKTSAYFYGNTVLNTRDLSGGNSQTKVTGGADASAYVGWSVHQGLAAVGGVEIDRERDLNIQTAISPAACLPNLSNLSAATTRAAVDYAVVTAAEATDIGVVATSHLIDWETRDFYSVVKWGSLPPGVLWPNLINQEPGEYTVSAWKRAFIDGSIEPGPGTELQIAADNAGTVIVTEWTHSTCTVERGQYIRLRAVNSELNGVAINVGFTWGDYRVSFTSTTAPLFEARGAHFDGASAYRATGLSQPAGTEGMFSLWFRNTQSAWNDGIQYIFQHRVGSAVMLALSTSSSGRMRVYLPNDTQQPSAFYSAASGNVQFQLNRWYHIMAQWTATGIAIYVDGNHVLTQPFTAFNMSGQTLTQMGIGSASTNVSVWNGDVGHLWLSVSQSIDISVSDNVAKFIQAGKPVDLGLDGSQPTGIAPEWYYDGIAPDWTNQGTGPGGVLVGTLTVSSSAPEI